MTKIKGLIQDISGAIRVTKMREEAFKNAKNENIYADPINQVARALHPAPFMVQVIKIEDVSITARMFTFKAINHKLPIFQAGNYVSIRVKIGATVTTRPYSISSAPYEARGENGFFSITVRRGKDDIGFVSNYLYDHLKLQDTLEVEMPFGHFYFESLRDSKDIVGIAGGSGITPFYSMAKEIAHGTLDYNLTILYGSLSHKDIILEDELDKIARECDRVKVIHVLSDENAELKDGDLSGFISRDIIKKYSIDQNPENGKTTYFICGPLPMYKYIKGELESLSVPKRRIRMEVFGTDKDVSKIEGYPLELMNKTGMEENVDYCFRRNLGEYIDDLDSNKNSDKMVIGGTIHLLSNLDLRDEFNSLFVSSGIKVRKVNLCEENLEEFFTRIISNT